MKFRLFQKANGKRLARYASIAREDHGLIYGWEVFDRETKRCICHSDLEADAALIADALNKRGE